MLQKHHVHIMLTKASESLHNYSTMDNPTWRVEWSNAQSNASAHHLMAHFLSPRIFLGPTVLEALKSAYFEIVFKEQWSPEFILVAFGVFDLL